MSDGMQFLILIKDDERARNHLYEIQISSELFSYKRPKDWDERLVELSEEKIKENKGIREIMSRLMLVFCSCRSRGMERAIPYIERIVQLPVTKENKFSLVVFIVGTFYIKPFIRWIVFLCKKQRNMQRLLQNGPKWILPYTRNY